MKEFGQRLFKNVLLFLGEELDNKSFVDIFNRLEQLNIISDYDNWLELRAVRNEIAYEYEDNPAENAIEINKIYEMKDNLVTYFTQIKNYLDARKERNWMSDKKNKNLFLEWKNYLESLDQIPTLKKDNCLVDKRNISTELLANSKRYPCNLLCFEVGRIAKN